MEAFGVKTPADLHTGTSFQPQKLDVLALSTQLSTVALHPSWPNIMFDLPSWRDVVLDERVYHNPRKYHHLSTFTWQKEESPPYFWLLNPPQSTAQIRVLEWLCWTIHFRNVHSSSHYIICCCFCSGDSHLGLVLANHLQCLFPPTV